MLQFAKLEAHDVPQEELDKDEQFLTGLQEVLEQILGELLGESSGQRIAERLICRQIRLYKWHICDDGGVGLSDNIGAEKCVELAFDDPRLDD